MSVRTASLHGRRNRAPAPSMFGRRNCVPRRRASRTNPMYSELFVAQHRGPSPAGEPMQRDKLVGYFWSFADTAAALDERYLAESWQGIRDECTGERWWRSAGVTAWTGPVRPRR